MSDILILPSGGGSGSDDCTATRAQLLSGYTGILSDTDDEPGAGTMVNRGAVSQSLPINGSYTIPQGYHNGSGKVTQSIPTQGGSTTTPGTAAKTIVAANRYVTGNIVVAGDANLVPGNIKKNVTIFGVRGTWEGYVADTTDLFDNGNNAAGFSFNRGSISSTAILVPKMYGTSAALFRATASKTYPFGNYTRLNIDFDLPNGTSGSNNDNPIRLRNGSNTLAEYNYTTGYYPQGRRTIQIDISSISLVFAPVIEFDRVYTWNSDMYIYKIWLS